MEEEKEVIFRDGVFWVSPKRYLRYIAEGKELLEEDFAKLLSLNPKPKGWIKIRNKINAELKIINNTHLGLEDRAMVFIRYLNARDSFRNVLGEDQSDR